MVSIIIHLHPICYMLHGSISVGLVIWLVQKFLNKYWVDCFEIVDRHSWSQEDEPY